PDVNDPNKLGDGAARVEKLSNLIAIFQKPELDFSKNRAEHDDTEALRVSFYKGVATLVRAYAELAGNLTEAGYSNAEVGVLQREVEFYSDTRAAIKKHSG